MIEFASTELINLIDVRFRSTIDRDTPFEHAYEHLYWQAAGKNYNTGQKSILLDKFEKKYMGDFIDFMKDYNTTNISMKFKSLPDSVRNNIDLVNTMRHYDYTVNVKWVMSHYKAAAKYIGGGAATGGSDWTKYMLPKYQKRIFYPDLWSEEEIENWGITNLESYKILTEV